MITEHKIDGVNASANRAQWEIEALAKKGYPYQYLFCQGAGHGLRKAKEQFLAHAIEWVWHDSPTQVE